MPDTSQRLRAAVESWGARLATLDEAAAARSADGGWSPKEVVGHLIDSASVNLERFLRARDTEHLDFPGYPQDAWVRAGGYAAAPWAELLALWAGLNAQVARVMEGTPAAVRERPRETHALDRIAWRAVPRGSPATLEYLMADYVDHLEHHLTGLRLV